MYMATANTMLFASSSNISLLNAKLFFQYLLVCCTQITVSLTLTCPSGMHSFIPPFFPSAFFPSVTITTTHLIVQARSMGTIPDFKVRYFLSILFSLFPGFGALSSFLYPVYCLDLLTGLIASCLVPTQSIPTVHQECSNIQV